VPIVKYLVTVGSVLTGFLFFMSYVLGPPSDEPRFVRTAAVTVKTAKKPVTQTVRETSVHQESKAHPAKDGGTETRQPLALPQTPAMEAGVVANEETDALAESVPIPRPRPIIEDAMSNSPAQPAVLPVAKKPRKAATVTSEQVRRAYLALRTPSAPPLGFAFDPRPVVRPY
jgi:hypothetical protein